MTATDVLASDLHARVVLPRVSEGPGDPNPDPPPRGRNRPTRWVTGWPIAVVVVGWPVAWAVGLTNVILVLAAVPLAWELYKRGRVRVPPGFWIWAVFLVWVLASVLAMDALLEGTLPPNGMGRYIAFAARLLNYLAVTVVLLYVGNASEKELPRERVIGWMAWLAVSTIALGCLAVVFPHFGFNTLMSHVLPGGLVTVAGGTADLAQVQSIIGEATTPRPAAPFVFTNAWGNNLALLLMWLVVAWGPLGGNRRRLLLALVLTVAAVPIVYSLNRGVWLGLGIALVVLVVRLAVVGRTAALAALVGIAAAGLAVFALSPLTTMVQARADAGHSNEIRAALATGSVNAGLSSPIVGYGSTRAVVGSADSIAIGRSPTCPKCGNANIGSTGQVWLVLIAQGLVGVLLYLGFFLRSLWAYRHDHSVLGIVGAIVIVMELFFGFFYTALIMPLMVTMLSIALLWRNQQARAVAR